MCGIIGVLSRRPTRPTPDRAALVARLESAIELGDDIDAVTLELAGVDELLRGVPGVLALADHHDTVAAITARLDQLDAVAHDLDARLEAGGHDPETVELMSARSLALRDVLWALRHDRLRTAAEVGALAGRDAGIGSLSGYLAIQQSLSALDRLEVRVRDSAGIHVFVSGHGLDLDDSNLRAAIADRSADPTYQSGSVRVADGLSLIHISEPTRHICLSRMPSSA